MEKNNNFFEWYKRKITGDPQDPPAEAWDNIADELDTNDVWDKVAARLDNPGRWFHQRPWNYALPALLLLLIAGGGYFLYDKALRDAPLATVSTYAVADSLSRDVDADEKEVAVGDEKPAETPTMDGNDRSAGRNDITSNTDPRPEDTATSRRSKEILPENTATDVEGSTIAKAPSGDETFAVADHNAVANGNAFADSNADTDDNAVAERSAEPDDEADAEIPLIADSRSREVKETISPSTDSAIAAEVQVTADERSSRESDITTEADSSRESGEAGSSPNEKAGGTAIQRDAYTSVALSRMILPDSMLIVEPLALTIEPDSFDAAIDFPSVAFSPSLEFGISGAVKNTWLLNHTTFAGLERHTLTTTLPDFGKNIGMAMRYNFARRFSAQAETFFIAEIGQRYNEYRKGKYIGRELDLNYFHGSLLLKYGNNAMMLDQLVNGHGIIGGLYFSKLKNATETIDGHTTGISDAYSSSDYGIILGYEYNQRLFSNFFFTSGVRLNYGLKNIRPASVSKTGTGSFDVNLGVRYRFKR